MNIRKIIREEIEKILNPPSEVIDIDVDDIGNIFGVVHYDREHLNNWINNEKVNSNFDSKSDEDLFPVGILKNINVNEEYRNQGYGNELFDRFIEETSHCSYIVLIADTSEKQMGDFDLVKWYERKGFHIFGESGGMPVMISKVDDIIGEIDLGTGGRDVKPGIPREFPQQKVGGQTLNISIADGPHEFPYRKSF
jgi:hypothetical protein